MARPSSSSVALLMLLVVAAPQISLHLLLLPPLVSSAAVVRPPRPLLGKIAIRGKQVLQDITKEALNDIRNEALNGLLKWLTNSGSHGQQRGSAPANTFSLIVFSLSVGTPAAQDVTGILDITSQLVWAQCGPCTSSCPTSLTFQTDKSATFSKVPCASQTCQLAVLNKTCGATDSNCDHIDMYGQAGYLATDTFSFNATPFPGMVFGCSGGTSAGDFSGAPGVIGFGRGPLSLVSQLNLSRFSYSLAFDDSDGSDTVIQLGSDAVPQTKRSRSTPLHRSNMYPGLYYVKLIGIQVDGQALNGIPAGTFELQANGSGGVFLSTTMPVTFLEEAAYNVVRREFESRIPLRTQNGWALGLDLCYTMQSMANVAVPNLTLVFDGKEAAMELKTQNYFFTDNTNGLVCLTILPSRGWSLLGSLLQTGKTMTYDLDGEQLTFETAAEAMQKAGAPPPPPVQVSLMIIAPFLALVLLF